LECMIKIDVLLLVVRFFMYGRVWFVVLELLVVYMIVLNIIIFGFFGNIVSVVDLVL